MDYRVSHTFSDFFIMPRSLFVAAKSERRFLPRNKITAFYTPPRSDEIYESINKLITVKKVPNITDPFSTGGAWHSHYGEKIHASKLNSPNILFMDCDVLVVHNPEPIWDIDFDLAVAPVTPAMREHMKSSDFTKRWNKFFESHGKKPRKHFECPIMFFKDNILKEIEDEYITLMAEKIEPVLPFFDKEQMVIALLMSDKKVEYLTYNEIGDFRFRDKPFYTNIVDWEAEPTPIIWHIGNQGLVIQNI